MVASVFLPLQFYPHNTILSMWARLGWETVLDPSSHNQYLAEQGIWIQAFPFLDWHVKPQLLIYQA